MFFFKKSVLGLLMLVLLSATFGYAPRWEKLGERKVAYRVDRDEIIVTAREGRFTALKLLVRNADLNIHQFTVHFNNGQSQNVEMRDRIPAGGESRIIDLDGKGRFIEKVVFWYDTQNDENRRSTVELWGRHNAR
jgi:hypothetical protein